MDNHVHALVKTPAPNLSAGMQLLLSLYARWFNRRRSRVGHLFHARFHAALIESDGHLLEALRYVALNPVRAGLCERPESWAWSSFGATAGLVRPPPFLDLDWILELFSAERGEAQRCYRHFVAEASRRRLAVTFA